MGIFSLDWSGLAKINEPHSQPNYLWHTYLLTSKDRCGKYIYRLSFFKKPPLYKPRILKAKSLPINHQNFFWLSSGQNQLERRGGSHYKDILILGGFDPAQEITFWKSIQYYDFNIVTLNILRRKRGRNKFCIDAAAQLLWHSNLIRLTWIISSFPLSWRHIHNSFFDF